MEQEAQDEAPGPRTPKADTAPPEKPAVPSETEDKPAPPVGRPEEADIESRWTVDAEDGEPQRFLGGFCFQDRRGKEIALEHLEKSGNVTCTAFLVRPDWESWQSEFGDSGTPFDESDAGPHIKVPVKTWCVEYRDDATARIWFMSDTAQYCLVEGAGAPKLQPSTAKLMHLMRQKVDDKHLLCVLWSKTPLIDLFIQS